MIARATLPLSVTTEYECPEMSVFTGCLHILHVILRFFVFDILLSLLAVYDKLAYIAVDSYECLIEENQ